MTQCFNFKDVTSKGFNERQAISQMGVRHPEEDHFLKQIVLLSMRSLYANVFHCSFCFV